MSLSNHPSTATREHGAPCKWCRAETYDDSAVCHHVGCQNAEHHARRSSVLSPPPAWAVGERVRFVGLNPRPWETTGTVSGQRNEFTLVVWDSDPYGTAMPIHPSQLEVTYDPPMACKHAYRLAPLVSVVPSGTPCARCGEPSR